MIEPVSTLVGGLLLAVGWLIGRFAHPSRRKGSEPRPPKAVQPKAVCGCGHHLSKHDPQTGRCHHSEAVFSRTTEVVKDQFGTPVRDSYDEVVTITHKNQTGTVECGCRRYIGPEPITTLYSPELTSDAAAEVSS